jgi:hypothetical protein
MRRRINRRLLLAGGGAALLAVAGGVIGVRTIAQRTRSADDEAAEYATLLADVHDDYVNGRVVEHHGWILSQHEFDSIAARKADRAGASTAEVS